MTKALRKNTLREIRSTKARFLSILAIIGLGVGFFAGVKAASPAMTKTSDEYYVEQNLMDFRLVSTVGFDDGDLKAVADIDGVKQVAAAYSADVIVNTDGTGNVVRLYSLPQKDGDKQPISEPVLVDGRLPEKSGEIAVESRSYEGAFKIGDTIHIEAKIDNTDTKDILKTLDYKVVGLVQSPMYISFERGTTTIGNGKVSQYMMIPPQDFSYERYTDIYATTKYLSADISSFSDTYKDGVNDISKKLKSLSGERLEVFDQSTLEQARQELENGVKEYSNQKNKAEKELKKAQEALDAAQKEYDTQIKKGKEKLSDAQKQLEEGQALLPSKITEFYEEIAQAQEQISRNEAKLDKAELQYEASKKEYDEKIAAAEKELADGEAEYKKQYEEFYTHTKPQAAAKLDALEDLLHDAQQTVKTLEEQLAGATGEAAQRLKEALSKAQGLISVYQDEIKSGRQQLIDGEQQLKDAKTKLEDGAAELKEQKESGAKQLAQAKEEIDSGKQELEKAKGQLAQAKKEGKRQLDDAQKQLITGKYELEDGKSELDRQEKEGQEKLDEGKKTLASSKEEAQEKLKNAERELQLAQKRLDSFSEMKWYIFTRDDNPGYSTFIDNANRVDAVAQVFPLFFLLVAALVCLTTMTRMVEERRTEIGTLKALGYSSGSIMAKYLIYATIAGLSGALVGLAFGVPILPNIIFNAYAMMYSIKPLTFVMPWLYIVIGIAAALVCTTTVAYITCYKELKGRPAGLMRPKAPKKGKRIILERIPILWKHMSFTSKVTARNLLRYKARFLMTVLGVAGCTALIIAGFGIKDSISVIVDKQFQEIYKYDTVIVTKSSNDFEQAKPLFNDVNADSRIAGAALVEQKAVKAFSDKSSEKIDEIYVFTPQDTGDMENVIDLHERESGAKLTLSDDGAVVTEKLAKTLNIGVGDTIRFEDDGEEYSVPVTGISENYLYGYIYLSPGSYEKVYGESSKYNMILAKTSSGEEDDQKSFAKDMLARGDIAAVSSTSDGISNFEDMIQSLNMVVYVLIICAGALAFVVLYNLTNINIAERVREIATIKVLGFYNKEVSAYVYRENIVLTIAGILLGLVMGVFLTDFIVQTVEIDNIMFGRGMNAMSFLWAIGLTALFSLLVNWLMYYKMKAVSMVESLKSIE